MQIKINKFDKSLWKILEVCQIQVENFRIYLFVNQIDWIMNRSGIHTTLCYNYEFKTKYDRNT